MRPGAVPPSGPVLPRARPRHIPLTGGLPPRPPASPSHPPRPPAGAGFFIPRRPLYCPDRIPRSACRLGGTGPLPPACVPPIRRGCMSSISLAILALTPVRPVRRRLAAVARPEPRRRLATRPASSRRGRRRARSSSGPSRTRARLLQLRRRRQHLYTMGSEDDKNGDKEFVLAIETRRARKSGGRRSAPFYKNGFGGGPARHSDASTATSCTSSAATVTWSASTGRTGKSLGEEPRKDFGGR